MSIIDSIKSVQETFPVSLGAAKQAVSQHPAWREAVEANQPLHEEAIAALDLLEKSAGGSANE